MRIGNLSRAGRPSGGHSGRLLRVLSLAGIGAMLLAGWQVLPFALQSDPSGRASTAALTSSEAPGRALGHGEPQAKRPPAATAPAPAAAAMPIRAAAAPESPAPAPAATAPRVVYSGPLVTSSAAPGAAPGQPPAPEPAQAPAVPVRSLAPAPAPIPAPIPAQSPAPAPVAEPAPTPRLAPEAPPQRVAAAAAPAATGRVDLNAASVEELNAIPGAGLIGRAIVRGRPYAAPEDLVTKRVLNRAAFERIKDQITAQ